MLEAITYQNMLKEIKRSELLEDTIGILITRPDLETGKDIINSLGYYHHLTGKNINFFLPGFGAYWPDEMYPDQENVVTIDHATWSFSNMMFVDFIHELEEITTWKYTGESELLLISYHDQFLDFSVASQFWLDQMLKDGVISSTSSFFTQLARLAKKNNSVSSMRRMSGLANISKSLIDEFVDSLPKYLSHTIREGKYYIARDFSK